MNSHSNNTLFSLLCAEPVSGRELVPSHEITGAHTFFALELLLENSQLAAPAIDEITLFICFAYSSRLTVGSLINNFRFIEFDLLTVKVAVARRPFNKSSYLTLDTLCRLIEVRLTIRLSDHAGICSFGIILHLVYSCSVCDLRDRLSEEACTCFSKDL